MFAFTAAVPGRREVQRLGARRHGELGARFEDAHTLTITSRDDIPLGTVRAKTFLIATGSRVARVEIPGLKEVGYLTSDQGLELAEIPKSALILGAGAIAMEAAHHFSALGCAVDNCIE